VSARVTVEVDERLKRLERLEQGEEDEEDEARLDISDAREASSVRRGRGRVRPGDVLRDVVAAVERRGTSRVASVGASVEISNPRFPIEHRAGFSSETRAFSVRVSLVVVVPACGGSADLLDALVACEGCTEARVDACGPRRDEAKKDIEDVEDEPNAPLLFPRRRARASS